MIKFGPVFLIAAFVRMVTECQLAVSRVDLVVGCRMV